MSRAVVLLAASTLLLAGCTTRQPETTLTTSQFHAQTSPQRAAEPPLSPNPVVSLSEPRRSQFRLAAEASFGNVDRAQPLSARLLDVNVVLAEADAGTDEATRNRYVGLLLTASNQRCSAYKEMLTETDREGNFLFGALSTVLGGLGAIFTPAATARSLAGAAGISSGLRSDFNSSFFYEKTVALLVKSIDSARASELGKIDAKFKLTGTQWPMARALADVQTYHDKCSLAAAFAELGETVNRPQPESLDVQLTRQALVNSLAEFGTRCTSSQRTNDPGCTRLATLITDLRKQLPVSPTSGSTNANTSTGEPATPPTSGQSRTSGR